MTARRSTPRRPPLSAPRGQLRAAYRLAGGMSPASWRASRPWPSGRSTPSGPARLPGVIEALPRWRSCPRRSGCASWSRWPGACSRWRWPTATGGPPPSSPTRCAAAATPPLAGQGLIAAQARAAAPPPAEPQPARPHRPRPYDPVDAAMGRAASGLRAILGLEAAYAHLPEPQAAGPATRRPPASSPPGPAAPTP